MKILHINCNYTGTTLHQNMVKQLNSLNIKNNVFVPVHAKHISAITPDKYVKLSVCFRKWDRLFFKYKQHKIYNNLLNYYNPADFDIIHAYTLFTDGNCAYELSKRYHLPYIVTVRNTDLNSFFKLRPDLRGRGIEIMKHASAICFLSPAYKRNLFLKYIPRKQWREFLRKIYIIPNGIDDFWHQNMFTGRNYSETLERFKQKKLSVVYAGAINKNKNLLTTCRALDELQKEGWEIRYTAVGKVQDQKIAQQVTKRNYARLLNPVPKEKLVTEFRSHDIFVMPSLTETFGLVYAEAMSQGVPVIYSKGEGFDGHFKDGYCGYSVLSTNATKLKQRILCITEKYPMLSQHALTGSTKFKWNKICLLYVKIYKQILEKNI